MREEEIRADVAAEVPQVLVRPGRAHLALEARLAVVRVIPAEPEPVAVGRGVAFHGAHALHHERVGRRRHIAFELDGLSAIGDPAAHRADSPCHAMITPEWRKVSPFRRFGYLTER